MRGDEYMKNDLLSYMKEKAEKLVLKDEVKQKMAGIRK